MVIYILKSTAPLFSSRFLILIFLSVSLLSLLHLLPSIPSLCTALHRILLPYNTPSIIHLIFLSLPYPSHPPLILCSLSPPCHSLLPPFPLIIISFLYLPLSCPHFLAPAIFCFPPYQYPNSLYLLPLFSSFPSLSPSFSFSFLVPLIILYCSSDSSHSLLFFPTLILVLFYHYFQSYPILFIFCLSWNSDYHFIFHPIDSILFNIFLFLLFLFHAPFLYILPFS